MAGALDFFKADYWGTLYPLKVNLVVLECHEAEVSKYINEKILGGSPADNFLPQQRVYATKPRGHLRRTFKLDPVSEYFIYDLIYRNRSAFRKEVSPQRASFGYRFENGAQVSIGSAFRQFRKVIAECKLKYTHHVRFDIASYFNSLYHHDVAHWFSSRDGVTNKDSEAFSRFIREINAGRSVDFLPQGIYPTKMIGNEFLKFVELSGQVKCAQTVRFMDDFYLFDNSESVIAQDFTKIQQLLGGFGLNINPSKTAYDDVKGDVASKVTAIQKSLMQVVEIETYIDTPSGVEIDSEEVEIESSLNSEQIEILLGYLKDDALEESDADLILNILRSNSDSILEYLPILLSKFPNIYKHIYAISTEIEDKEALASVILEFIEGNDALIEHQIFWLGVIAEESLAGTSKLGPILLRLYELSLDHKIARAKILEMPFQDFGFKEIRADYLKAGASDWLSWASAVGSRTLKKGERNYALDYFSKCSPLNFIVASAVMKLD